MRPGDVGTRISPYLPPGRQHLARTLTALYRKFRPEAPSLSSLAELLLKQHRYATNKGSLSKYFNGKVVPDAHFGRHLYTRAVAAAGSPAAVGLTLRDVEKAHAEAEPTSRICKECPGLRRRNASLRKENELMHEREAGLVQELTKVQRRAVHPPVPVSAGDRRRSQNDITGAKRIAKIAAELRYQGKPDEALALLADTAGSLTPLESAASIVILRGQHEKELADAMLCIYGRERPEQEIIQAAVKLHDSGMASDAAAMLRAATKRPYGAE